MEQNISCMQRIKALRNNMPDWLFVLWAGGTALLSYSLV